MCLVLVGWQVHPDIPLIVAANRDEYFERPSQTAEFWPDRPGLLAGRDLRCGGTWMGVTRSGRFAALTNHRDPARYRPDAHSRGPLVSDFLAGDQTPQVYAASLLDGPGSAYNGFNLLLGDLHELVWISNVSAELRVLAPGIFGLSNELLDTPWPKVEQSKSAMARALGRLPDDQPLFDLLRDDTTFPDQVLPRTGVSVEWERLLSAAFVRGQGYGTRSSAVVLRDRSGTMIFDEQIWLAGGAAGPRRRFRFRTA